MNQLSIIASDIDDEAALALGQCSHKIQHLYLSGCNLTTIGWTSVFSAVAKMEEKASVVELMFFICFNVQFSLKKSEILFKLCCFVCP